MPVIRRSLDEILIRPKWSRSRRFSVIGGSVVAAVVLLMAAWYGGVYSARKTSAEEQARLAALESRLATADVEFEALKQNLATAERTMQISKTAYAELDQALAINEQDLESMKAELGFYQSIISPGDGSVGLRIYDLETRPMEGAVTEFTVTLIQSIRHDEEAEGEVHVEVWGEGLKEPVSRWPLKGGRPFSFRYFERMDGSVKIPDELASPRLCVVVIPADGGTEPIRRWYP